MTGGAKATRTTASGGSLAIWSAIELLPHKLSVTQLNARASNCDLLLIGLRARCNLVRGAEPDFMVLSGKMERLRAGRYPRARTQPQYAMRITAAGLRPARETRRKLVCAFDEH